ncbi:putative odorant-binding protein A5 isoform X2 [Bemisia tabaci]
MQPWASKRYDRGINNFKMTRRKQKPANRCVEQFSLVISLLVVCVFKTVLPKALDVDRILRRYKIIPDIIDEAPKFVMDVAYRNNVIVEMGNKLDPIDMKLVPKVKWPTKNGIFYTLLMVDPDIPVAVGKKPAQRQHWIVGNIPGWNFRRGETITGYMGPMSPKYEGLRRTTFLVYSQKKRINFTEPRYSSKDR